MQKRYLAIASILSLLVPLIDWGLRDYQTGEWVGGDEGCDHKPRKLVPVEDKNNWPPDAVLRNDTFCAKCGATRKDDQIGMEKTPEEYVAKLVEVFRELRRVLRDDGTCWINLGSSYAGSNNKSGEGEKRNLSTENFHGGTAHLNQRRTVGNSPNFKPKDLVPIPWLVALALQRPHLKCNHCDNVAHRDQWGILPQTFDNEAQLEALMLGEAKDRLICPNCFHADGHTVDTPGWYLRSDIIWNKLNPMPESVTDRPTKAHEYIFLLTKSAKYWYDADAIREPYQDSSMQRINQPNFDNQTGGPKDYRNGINKNRSMRQTLENFKTSENKGRNRRTVWPASSPDEILSYLADNHPSVYAEIAEQMSQKSDVFTVASAPYKKAHFATFPPKLIEPCILAGCPPRVCVECGEPWVRVVEKGKPFKTGGGNTNLSSVGPMDRNGQGQWDKGAFITGATTKTLGFAPTCQCCPLPANKSAHRPGIVLDPFIGSGTTAQVAIQNKLDWLGIELNPKYIKLAMERIHGTQPALFLSTETI